MPPTLCPIIEINGHRGGEGDDSRKKAENDLLEALGCLTWRPSRFLGRAALKVLLLYSLLFSLFQSAVKNIT